MKLLYIYIQQKKVSGICKVKLWRENGANRERKRLFAFELGVLLKATVTLPMLSFTDTTCASMVAVTLFLLINMQL